MILSDFLDSQAIKNDSKFELTHYTNSSHSGTCTFAASDFFLQQALENPNVSAVIVPESLVAGRHIEKGLVFSDSPKELFFELHNRAFASRGLDLVTGKRISPEARISPTAIIRDGVVIEDGVVVDDYAIIESNTIIKKGAYIGTHAVIGGRGMHDTFVNNRRIWVHDAGGVVLEESVQVLSHAVVQKSYFKEFTRIGSQSIVSVHCNVGHGCQVGSNTLIAGSAQLAGYVEVGDNVWIGPSVTVAHGLRIGNSAELILGSVVVSDVPESQKVSGNFAMAHAKSLRKYAKESR